MNEPMKELGGGGGGEKKVNLFFNLYGEFALRV